MGNVSPTFHKEGTMKVFAAGLAILAFGSVASASQCLSNYYSRPCLGSSEIPSGFSSYLATGDPCFSYGGSNYCFISTSGSISTCDCSNDACGCGKKPVDHCTNEGVDLNPTCSADQSKYCASAYDYMGYQNTKCLYCGVDVAKCNNKVCTVGITKDADKQAIVDAHNALRRKVAKGLETEGAPGPQPSAANMMELEWDDELASWAQLWVEQCTSGHDKDRVIASGVNGYVGQNRYDNWNSGYSATRDYAKYVQAWFDEVKDWPASYTSSFRSTAATTGHYTQVVWGKTSKVGCGFIAWKSGLQSDAQYPYRQAFVCNYWVAGNFMGAPLYIEGTAASQCPSGTVADDGLCKSS